VIDAEVRRFISEAEGTARRVLTESRAALDAIAERLLEVETIEGDELRRLLAPAPAAR
jgi:cell division protease FtsH